jgi:nucleoside triphosphate diphosphatase
MSTTQFPKLVELMARLRSPGGCPWDREQTYDTIKPFLLEETYEVVDAIGRRDWDEFASELGDLLLQVVFFAQMASEDGHFTIEDVIERIHSKMVRRHPHVFGDAKADSASDVLRNWEVLKANEKKQRQAEQGKSFEPPKSVLEGVSASIPSLMQAYQLSSRAAHVGFDWKRLQDVLEKLREETAELESAAMTQTIAAEHAAASKETVAELHSKVESEVGDLLFTAVNVARFLKVDPESALRRTNQKFRRRFQWVEAELAKSGKTPRDSTLEEMDALWDRSKEAEADGH